MTCMGPTWEAAVGWSSSERKAGSDGSPAGLPGTQHTFTPSYHLWQILPPSFVCPEMIYWGNYRETVAHLSGTNPFLPRGEKKEKAEKLRVLCGGYSWPGLCSVVFGNFLHLTRTAGRGPGAHTDAVGPCHGSGWQGSHPHMQQNSSATERKKKNLQIRNGLRGRLQKFWNQEGG